MVTTIGRQGIDCADIHMTDILEMSTKTWKLVEETEKHNTNNTCNSNTELGFCIDLKTLNSSYFLRFIL